jgi:hypothetical protein
MSVLYEEVVSLVDQLTPEEQRAIVDHVLEKPKKPKLSADEFRQWLESLAYDVGSVSTGYSDRREDWYGDDGR